MSKKRLFFISATAIILILIIAGISKNNGEPKYSLAEVVRTNIIEQVSETGQVEMGEKIELAFEQGARIDKIYVKVGDEVKAGHNLLKLDTRQLNIKLEEAQAGLDLAQAELDKLLAGASEEEIRLSQTEVDNARNKLEDVKRENQEKIDDAYQDSEAYIDSAYSKAVKALNVLDEDIFTSNNYFESYFIITDAQSKNDAESKKGASDYALSVMKTYYNMVKGENSTDNVDTCLEKFEKGLIIVQKCLTLTYDALANNGTITSTATKTMSTYKSNVSSAKTDVDTALSNISASIQNISLIKASNQTNLNTAEGAFKKAQDQLLLKTAAPRNVDIAFYQAKVDQAKSKVKSLTQDIYDAYLKAPVNGRIAEIYKETGEIVQTGESIVSFIPADPYQIKVHIYEEDIVKVKVDNAVDINLTAFPDKIFKGKVINVNPGEKLIDEVVYYEVTIGFEEEVPEGMKPGMTADIVIQTDFKENVLAVQESAIQKKDGKYFVQVLKGDSPEQREVEIGLKGIDSMKEVISGLKQGEQVILD